jgi:hypothetical protein
MDFFVVKKPKEVLKDMVMYKKESKKGNLVQLEIIVGLPGNSEFVPLELQTKEKVIYEGLTHSKFSTTPKTIPKGYKVWNTNKDHLLTSYLNKYIPEKEVNGLELQQWIQHYHDDWLTIKDVKEFPLNKKIKLLLLDRNIYDEKDVFVERKLYKPTTFFKKNYAWFWKTDNNNLKGKIIYEWQDKKEEPYDFEFDIEYEKNNWYPLTDGILQDKHKQKVVSVHKNKHVSKFPENTPLGYRGPIIVWNKIKDMEKLYYYT